MSFIDAAFPQHYAYGAVESDDWLSEIVETLNRHESRNAPLSDPRRSWDLSTTHRDQSERDGIHAVFMAMRGRFHTFPFRSFIDYSFTPNLIGVGDGFATTFQLKKAYIFGSETYYRTITKPVTSSVNVFINGIVATGWTVNRLTGQIVFSVAPSAGAVVSAGCTFDVPVRFADPKLSWRAETRTQSGDLRFICDQLALIEVIGE